ncbi:MAG: hypothetical protein KF709_03060 [Gemmatimonadaceae bacterium]|nr:hypothetical protein [Gemmatimonadaceae bacterium]
MLRLTALRTASIGLLALTLAACNEDDTTTGPTESGAAVIAANITADRTLYKDTVYTLQGFVQVTNGATLNIQAGTVIQGDFATVGSSLFITRGARINAIGTAAEPIVFTSSRPVGSRQAGDWGGLIIIGNATINRSGTVVLEGTGTGPSNPSQQYSGGTDDLSNSGTLRYVRVEFAGYATATDAELNTFTLAAVGSGTTLEYLQSLYGLDDSFEFFGGTVDGKYFVSYESGDDHFDMSEGYRGRLQYLIAYQSRLVVPRAGAGNTSSDPQGIENDGCAGAGCDLGQLSTPYTTPVVANFTLVGAGAGTDIDATSGGYGLVLRRGTGGYYVNGLVARWPKAGFSLRDSTTIARVTGGQFDARNILVLESPMIFGTASSGLFLADSAARNIVRDGAVTMAANTTTFTLPATSAASFDWTPPGGSLAATGGLTVFAGNMATAAGTAVSGTAYRGAAAPGGVKWWAGWTRYATN